MKFLLFFFCFFAIGQEIILETDTDTYPFQAVFHHHPFSTQVPGYMVLTRKDPHTLPDIPLKLGKDLQFYRHYDLRFFKHVNGVSYFSSLHGSLHKHERGQIVDLDLTFSRFFVRENSAFSAGYDGLHFINFETGQISELISSNIGGGNFFEKGVELFYVVDRDWYQVDNHEANLVYSGDFVYRIFPSSNGFFWQNQNQLFFLDSQFNNVDITPPNYDNPIGVVNDKLVFGQEMVHAIDSGGQVLLLNEMSGSNPPKPSILFEGSLYFSRSVPGTLEEIWRTDGTPEGTELFLDFNLVESSNPFLKRIVNGKLLFIADAGDGFGREFYAMDANGVVQLLADMVPGPFGLDESVHFSSNQSQAMIGFDNVLYLTDATPEGTLALALPEIEVGNRTPIGKTYPFLEGATFCHGYSNAEIHWTFLSRENLVFDLYEKCPNESARSGDTILEANLGLKQYDLDQNSYPIAEYYNLNWLETPQYVVASIDPYTGPSGVYAIYPGGKQNLIPGYSGTFTGKVNDSSVLLQIKQFGIDKYFLSDGTTAGTHEIHFIFEDQPLENISFFNFFKNQLILNKSGKLYVYDFQNQTVSLLFDSANSSGFSDLGEFFVFKGGGEYYYCDGTPDGIWLLTDEYPFANQSTGIFLWADGQLYGSRYHDAYINLRTGKTGGTSLSSLTGHSFPITIQTSLEFGKEFHAIIDGDLIPFMDYNLGHPDGVGSLESHLQEDEFLAFMDNGQSGFEPHRVDFAKEIYFDPEPFTQELLDRYDLNQDQKLDVVEVGLPKSFIGSEFMDIQLDVLEKFPLLRYVDLSHSGLTSLSGFSHGSLGIHITDYLDLRHNGLTEEDCPIIQEWAAKFDNIYANFYLNPQGDAILPPPWSTWHNTYNITDFITGIYTPAYTLNCP